MTEISVRHVLGVWFVVFGGLISWPFASTTTTTTIIFAAAQTTMPETETDNEYSYVAQPLGIPFDGQHSGVAVVDLNQDGHNDLLFSAGRHVFDQSFAMINLGLTEDEEGNIVIKWSNALELGPVGRYYQVDAYVGLSSLQEGHVAVLLAGGSRSSVEITPARLLDVQITGGCSVEFPDNPCNLQWAIIWEDPNPQGDRNGALAPTITNLRTNDPAIVLASSACTAIYLPDINGVYGNSTYVLTPDEKDPNDDGNVDRAAGLAVGYIGEQPGIAVGARTQGTFSPAPPLVAILQTVDMNGYDFEFFVVDEGTEYEADNSVSLQPTGVVLDDWNGDGSFDIAVANFVGSNAILSAGQFDPIPHWYYTVDTEGGISNDFAEISGISRNVAYSTTDVGGRSIDSGILFPGLVQQKADTGDTYDVYLPDIVIGTGDSSVHFLANLGIDPTTRETLGFEEMYIHDLPGSCQVRDVVVAELKPCYMSVVCSVICFDSGNDDPDLLGNYVLYSRTPVCETTSTNNTDIDENGNAMNNATNGTDDTMNNATDTINNSTTPPTMLPSTPPTLSPTLPPTPPPTNYATDTNDGTMNNSTDTNGDTMNNSTDTSDDTMNNATSTDFCAELYSDCETNDDCCDFLICEPRFLNRSSICSSAILRARAKRTVGDSTRGGRAGKVKNGAP